MSDDRYTMTHDETLDLLHAANICVRTGVWAHLIAHVESLLFDHRLEAYVMGNLANDPTVRAQGEAT